LAQAELKFPSCFPRWNSSNMGRISVSNRPSSARVQAKTASMAPATLYREEVRTRGPDPDSDGEFEEVKNAFLAGSMAQCLAARRRASSVKKPTPPEGPRPKGYPRFDRSLSSAKELSKNAVAVPTIPAGPRPAICPRRRNVTAN
jgi:hypothetical protein